MSDNLNLDRLRARAETQLSDVPVTDSEVPSADKLLHELQVHQIELEMQIEELRRTHVILEQVRDRYIDLYDFAPVGYLTLTYEGLITEINLTATGLLGVDRRFATLVTSQDDNRWNLFLSGVKQRNKRQNIELTLKRSDGTELPVKLDCLCVIADDQSSMLRIMLTDMTECKQTQQSLQRKKQTLFELQRIAHIGSWSIELETGYISWSDEMYRIFGVTQETFGHSEEAFLELIHPEDRTGMEMWISECQTGKEMPELDFRIMLPDGTIRFICGRGELQYGEMNRALRMVGSAQDITERKQAERVLNMLKAMIDISLDGFWIADVIGNVLQVNEAYAQIIGYSIDELVNMHISQLEALEGPEQIKAHIEKVVAQGYDQFETRHRHKDGHLIDLEISVAFLSDFQQFCVFCRDITARKQAEAALLESENRYRALLQNAHDAILIADLNGSLKEINRAGEVLLGYNRNEILCMNVVNLHPADELVKVRQRFDGYNENVCALAVETKILCKNGRVVDVEIRPSIVEINGNKLVQGVFIDLTERKLLEKQRLVMEKAHRDSLIREVHHRIKNNLQGITGILHQFVGNHPETQELLNQVISQMQSIAVIHGLQGLAVTSSVRVCELTVAIAAGIESLWQKHITVEIPEGWIPCTITEAEAVPLSLVLSELISNAVKHGGADRQLRVMFSHEPNPCSIRLTIHNTGLIPVGFGLENTTCFGTGLQLVASLLPSAGTSLTWLQQGGIVVTTLGLDESVIQLESLTLNANER